MSRRSRRLHHRLGSETRQKPHEMRHTQDAGVSTDPEVVAIIQYLPHLIRELRFETPRGNRYPASRELIEEVDASVHEYLTARGGTEERGRRK